MRRMGCRGGVECEPHYPRGGSPRGRGPLSRVGLRGPREDGHPQVPRALGLWSVRVWQRGYRRWSAQYQMVEGIREAEGTLKSLLPSLGLSVKFFLVCLFNI